MGHGQRLYKYMYQIFSTNPQVHDITVEDPNDIFQEVRDRFDMPFLLITSLHSIRCDLKMLLESEALLGVHPSKMTGQHIKDIQEKFKLCEVLILFIECNQD